MTLSGNHWLLMAGFLVLFMQAGFAMVEGGLCRSKNSAHTLAMTMMVYPLGCLAFWAFGFALGWGNFAAHPVGPGCIASLGRGLLWLNKGIGIGGTAEQIKFGLWGAKGFFLGDLDQAGVFSLFFFTMVLMNVAATIPTGAMAERWRWSNFCLYGLWVALPYGIFAHWVWGGGWLAQAGRNWGLGHGAVDFAGSGVVHAMGGMIGLAGAIALGPRIGKYAGKRAQAIPGHSVPMVVLGSIILTVGWFGFTVGWVFAATDVSIGLVAVNTILAGAAGALAAMVYLQARRMKPDPSLMCNGLLAGLVAISAPCAFVDPWAAALIGAVAGVLVVLSIFFWDRVHIDDPVGAISIHGAGGLWGLIALGLLANGKYGRGWNSVLRQAGARFADGADGVRGALYGDYGQLAAQLLEAAVLAAFGFLTAYAWFKLSNRITPLRVSAEVEVQGLDLPEMGAVGYPDFTPRGIDTRRWG